MDNATLDRNIAAFIAATWFEGARVTPRVIARAFNVSQRDARNAVRRWRRADGR